MNLRFDPSIILLYIAASVERYLGCHTSGSTSPIPRNEGMPEIRPITGRLSLFPASSTPSAISFLAVGIPPCGGTSGAYPVVQCGEADGAAAPSSPAGHDATVVDGSNRRADPHAIFGSGLSAPLAGSRSRTLTMDVHLRSAFHP